MRRRDHAASRVRPGPGAAALCAAPSAWKAGQTPATLRETASIRVADEDWLAGRRLTEFQVAAPGQLIGPSLRCPVDLTLEDPQGRPRRKRVVYTVATRPATTIVRQDDY